MHTSVEGIVVIKVILHYPRQIIHDNPATKNNIYNTYKLTF